MGAQSDQELSFTLSPIGILRSPFLERVEAPRQPRVAESVEGRVELFPGRAFEDALLDLEQWDHLWLVVWFHRNADYRPKVQPPRSSVKRGVLATRAPYRPNPIGLSAVRLLRVEGLTLFIAGLDLLDGTPVLDVKPYVPYTDAIPHANHGWLEREAARAEAAPAPRDPIAAYQIAYEPLALSQLAFLAERGVELRPRLEASLALGPSPHAYRRIKKSGEGYVLAVKDWRVAFRADGKRLTVEQIKTGYRPNALFGAPDQAPDVHRAFVEAWPRAL